MRVAAASKMHQYRGRLAAAEAARAGEMKKRSTDFDSSAYGLRAYDDMERTSRVPTRSLTTKPKVRMRPLKDTGQELPPPVGGAAGLAA